MTGLAHRVAQNLNIHRDGTKFVLSPFEVEMRRRLWWHICCLDCRAAENQGTTSSISDEMFDTEIPLNIDDADISPESDTFPKSKACRTDMTFCLASFEITKTMCRINHQPLAGKDHQESKVKSLEEKVKIFEEYCQRVINCPSQTVNSPHSIDRVTVNFSKMMMVR